VSERITLGPGVTGFYRRGDFAPNEVPVEAFVGALERLPRVGWTLVSIDRGRELRSFHRAVVRRGARDAPLQLLLSRVARVLAAAREERDPLDGFFDFVEVPAEIARGAPRDWSIATPDALRRRLEPGDLEALRPVERKQVRYWGPETIGDVLYNRWD